MQVWRAFSQLLQFPWFVLRALIRLNSPEFTQCYLHTKFAIFFFLRVSANIANLMKFLDSLGKREKKLEKIIKKSTIKTTIKINYKSIFF